MTESEKKSAEDAAASAAANEQRDGTTPEREAKIAREKEILGGNGLGQIGRALRGILGDDLVDKAVENHARQEAERKARLAGVKFVGLISSDMLALRRADKAILACVYENFLDDPDFADVFGNTLDTLGARWGYARAYEGARMSDVIRDLQERRNGAEDSPPGDLAVLTVETVLGGYFTARRQMIAREKVVAKQSQGEFERQMRDHEARKRENAEAAARKADIDAAADNPQPLTEPAKNEGSAAE